MMKSIWIPLIITILAVICVFMVYENLEEEFVQTLNQLQQAKWHYVLGSFLILSADIVLPVPSSIVMYMNGFVLGLLAGTVLSFVSLMSGSVIGYYLGKLTSNGIKAQKEERAHHFLLKYGDLAIIITRGIPILAESICVVCGYNKMPFKNYFFLNAIGYFPLCLLFAFFGQSGYDSNNFLFSFILSLLVSAVFWFLGKRFAAFSPLTNEE